jgi:hypothetical protein
MIKLALGLVFTDISAGTSADKLFTPALFNILPYFDALIVSWLLS